MKNLTTFLIDNKINFQYKESSLFIPVTTNEQGLKIIEICKNEELLLSLNVGLVVQEKPVV